MIRSLFIIAAAGTVLAIVCLGGAAAVGGREFAQNGGWRINGDGWTLAQHNITWTSDDDTTTTRQIPWDGGEALTFDLAARVIYAQGTEPSITLSGPAELLERITFAEGRFGFEDGVSLSARSRPRITVTAPAVTRFTLNGSQSLEIRDYDQPTLDIAMAGSGDVEGWGRTDALSVRVNGSGDVDLEGLPAADARIEIHGSGDVEAAVTGTADVTIMGSGDVDLTTRPAQLNTRISGSGRVRQAA